MAMPLRWTFHIQFLYDYFVMRSWTPPHPRPAPPPPSTPAIRQGLCFRMPSCNRFGRWIAGVSDVAGKGISYTGFLAKTNRARPFLRKWSHRDLPPDPSGAELATQEEANQAPIQTPAGVVCDVSRVSTQINTHEHTYEHTHIDIPLSLGQLRVCSIFRHFELVSSCFSLRPCVPSPSVFS